MTESFTERVKELIRAIPPGKVATYGWIATLAGNPRAARQVARILHSCAEKDGLAWHRVINRNGRISLPPFAGYEVQKQLLEQEGIRFSCDDSIDLNRFHWQIEAGKSPCADDSDL